MYKAVISFKVVTTHDPDGTPYKLEYTNNIFTKSYDTLAELLDHLVHDPQYITVYPDSYASYEIVYKDTIYYIKDEDDNFLITIHGFKTLQYVKECGMCK